VLRNLRYARRRSVREQMVVREDAQVNGIHC
jgi:hypothetical protein